MNTGKFVLTSSSCLPFVVPRRHSRKNAGYSVSIALQRVESDYRRAEIANEQGGSRWSSQGALPSLH